MVLLHDQQPQLSALKMPPAPLASSPGSTASPSNSSLSPTMMPGGEGAQGASPMALLLKADAMLRHQGLASFTPVAAATTMTPFAQPPAIHHLAHMGGLPCAQEEEEPVGAMGPLADHPFTSVQPGVTDARVGLLPGLRTAEMLKFNGVRVCLRGWLLVCFNGRAGRSCLVY